MGCEAEGGRAGEAVRQLCGDGQGSRGRYVQMMRSNGSAGRGRKMSQETLWKEWTEGDIWFAHEATASLSVWNKRCEPCRQEAHMAGLG